MLRLTESVEAWGSADFKAVLVRELEQLSASVLPLQQGLAQSSAVSVSPHQVMIIDANDDIEDISVKVGVFYHGVIAGCNCADDPTPVEELAEYCVIRCVINKKTAEAAITLLQE